MGLECSDVNRVTCFIRLVFQLTLFSGGCPIHSIRDMEFFTESHRTAQNLVSLNRCERNIVHTEESLHYHLVNYLLVPGRLMCPLVHQVGYDKLKKLPELTAQSLIKTGAIFTDVRLDCLKYLYMIINNDLAIENSSDIYISLRQRMIPV